MTAKEYLKEFIRIKYNAVLDPEDIDLSFDQVVEVIESYYQAKSKEELKELKRLAHEGLPSSCIAGFDEVKFCHYRNGDGNKCQQCSDYLRT